jgi:hypothetical protein
VRLAYELDARYPEAPASPHGRYNVLRTGEPEWMSDIPDAILEAGARDAEHLRIIRALQLRSYVAAPLAGRDGVLGVLTSSPPSRGAATPRPTRASPWSSRGAPRWPSRTRGS